MMMPWEVRTTAAMVLPERSVTFSLTDLSGVLVAAIPELKGAPLEQLIVNDIRSLADSQQPTRRFFGQFIVALGRNANSHTPYDLLAGADPQKIRFDGLQASLIFRRLATDILMLTTASSRKLRCRSKRFTLLPRKYLICSSRRYTRKVHRPANWTTSREQSWMWLLSAASLHLVA